MTATTRQLLADPEIRRTFEEEFLFGEATETVVALLESLGLPRTELARRLGVSKGRVSQILSGSNNLTLKTLAAVGWALGIRFELRPTPMADRAGTPAESDPPPPMWITQLGREYQPRFVALAPAHHRRPSDVVSRLRSSALRQDWSSWSAAA